MKIISWNTQGKNPTALISVKEHNSVAFTSPTAIFGGNFAPDFICIQEAGVGSWNNAVDGPSYGWIPTSTSNPNGKCKTISNYQLGSWGNYNGYEIPWQQSDVDVAKNPNGRCSLVILWNSNLGNNFELGGWHNNGNTSRPVFWVTEKTHNYRVACIHAPAGGDTGYIGNAVNAIKQNFTGTWVLAGDFNVVPANLGNSIGTAQTVRSNGHTQISGNELDYAVQSGAGLTTCESGAEYVQSDHLQMRFR